MELLGILGLSAVVIGVPLMLGLLVDRVQKTNHPRGGDWNGDGDAWYASSLSDVSIGNWDCGHTTDTGSSASCDCGSE